MINVLLNSCRGILLKTARLLPDLPTVAKDGTPGYALTNAYGVFVPVRPHATRVDAIHKQSHEVIAARECPLEADGVDAAPSNSPADYRAVGRDIAPLEEFFEMPGISPDTFR